LHLLAAVSRAEIRHHPLGNHELDVEERSPGSDFQSLGELSSGYAKHPDSPTGDKLGLKYTYGASVKDSCPGFNVVSPDRPITAKEPVSGEDLGEVWVFGI
jgi:hypothetical protein